MSPNFPAEETLPPTVTREGGVDNPIPNDQSTLPKPIPTNLPPNTTRSWSNLPQDLSLATYFDPSRPNIATDFNLKGPVQPVIRSSKSSTVGRDIFLLRDGNGKFYQWFVTEGDMFRLDGLSSGLGVDQVVGLVMRDSGILAGRCGTQVWNLGRA